MSRGIAVVAAVIATVSARSYVRFGGSLEEEQQGIRRQPQLEHELELEPGHRYGQYDVADVAADSAEQNDFALRGDVAEKQDQNQQDEVVDAESSDRDDRLRASTAPSENSVEILQEGEQTAKLLGTSSLRDVVKSGYMSLVEGRRVVPFGYVHDRRCDFKSKQGNIVLECETAVQRGDDVFREKSFVTFPSAHARKCIRKKAQDFGILAQDFVIFSSKLTKMWQKDLNKMLSPKQRCDLFVKANQELREKFEAKMIAERKQEARTMFGDENEWKQVDPKRVEEFVNWNHMIDCTAQ